MCVFHAFPRVSLLNVFNEGSLTLDFELAESLKSVTKLKKMSPNDDAVQQHPHQSPVDLNI